MARAAGYCCRKTVPARVPSPSAASPVRKNFVLQLRTAGIEPVAEALYRDHHAYAEKDIRDSCNCAQQSEAAASSPPKKTPINLGAISGRSEPFAVVPVKMELSGRG